MSYHVPFLQKFIEHFVEHAKSSEDFSEEKRMYRNNLLMETDIENIKEGSRILDDFKTSLEDPTFQELILTTADGFCNLSQQLEWVGQIDTVKKEMAGNKKLKDRLLRRKVKDENIIAAHEHNLPLIGKIKSCLKIDTTAVEDADHFEAEVHEMASNIRDIQPKIKDKDWW